MRLFPEIPGFRYSLLVFFLLPVVAGQLLTGCGEETTSPPVDPDAQIVIVSPSGGETVKVGSILPIRWKLQGKGLEEVNAVNIEVSPDSGRNWIGLLRKSIALADPDWGDYRWTVPATLIKQGETYPLAGRTQVLLRVMQYTPKPDQIAVLSKPLAIAAP